MEPLVTDPVVLEHPTRALSSLDATFDKGFDAVLERLDRLEALRADMRREMAERLGAIDHRLDRLEHRLDRVEQRLP